MKRISALILSISMFFGCALSEELSETRIDTGERPAFVEQVLDIARAEIGYREGPNNYSKYGEWAGDANAAWCAEFVCWCIDQSDQKNGTQLLRVVYPKYSGQNTGKIWFTRRGRFVYRRGNCPDWGYQWMKGDNHYLVKNEFIPRSGDLLFFSYNAAGDTEHVALIEYVTRRSDGEIMIHVIEGNNPDAVQRNAYKMNNSQVLGFGICEDLIDTVMRTGNNGDKVRRLQEQLVRLDLLYESDITGTFGSNTKQAIMQFQNTELAGIKTSYGIADRVTQQAIDEAIRRLEFESPDNWLVEE